MAPRCPNTNTPAWKELEGALGRDKAYLAYFRHDGGIPSVERANELLKGGESVQFARGRTKDEGEEKPAEPRSNKEIASAARAKTPNVGSSAWSNLQKQNKKSPLASPEAVSNAGKKAAQRIDELANMEAMVKDLQRQKELIKPGQARDRVQIEKQIRQANAKTIDKAKQGVINYARGLGLTGVPYNNVELLVRNARDAKGLQKAINVMDDFYENTSRHEAQQELLARIQKEYALLRRAQSRASSSLDLEHNREMKEYLDSLMGNKPREKEQINRVLAYLNQHGSALVREKEFNDLPASIQEWTENPGGMQEPKEVGQAIRNLAAGTIANMKTTDLRKAIRDIDQIRKSGRTAQQEKQEARTRKIGSQGKEIASEIFANTKDKPFKHATSRDESFLEKAGRRLDKVLWENRDIDRICTALTGKINSAMQTHIVRQMAEKQSLALTLHEQALKFFDGTYGGTDFHKIRDEKWIDATMDGKPNNKGEVVPGKAPITLEDGMFFYAHSKNQSQREHLIATVNHADREAANNEIDRVVNALPQEYKDLVEKQWEYNDEVQYPMMSDAFSEVHSVDMNHESNYFSATNLRHNPNGVPLSDDLTARQMNVASAATGSTKERIVGGRDVYYEHETTGQIATKAEYGKMPEQDRGPFKKVVPPVNASPFSHTKYFNVLVPNLRESAHYAAYATVVRDINRLLTHPDVVRALDAKSPNVRRVLNEWLKSNAYGRYDYGLNKTAVDAVLNFARRNVGNFALIGNPKVLAIQMSILPRAMSMVGTTRVMASFGAMLRNPKEFYSDIDALSPEMRNRAKHFQQTYDEYLESTELQRAIKKLGPINKVGEALGGAIGSVDKFCAGIVWRAAFSESINKGASTKDAVWHADTIVRKNMPGGGLLAATQSQRGGASSRIFVQFAGDIIKQTQLMDEFVQGYKDLSLKDKMQYVAFGFLATAAIVTMVKEATINPMKKPEKLLGHAIRQNFDAVPIIGSIVDFAVLMGENKLAELRGAKGEWSSNAVPHVDPAALSALGQAFIEGKDVIKNFGTPKMIMPSIELGALASGIPGGGQAMTTIKGVKNFKETGDPRYLIWGKNAIESGDVESAMVQRFLRPKKGSDDRSVAQKWYNGLSEDQKSEFKKKLAKASDRSK